MIRNFGVIVARVIQLHEEEDFGYEEIRQYHAPSECGDLVSKGVSDEIDSFLAEHGLTRKTYNGELEARVSGKWIYNNHAYVDDEPYQKPCHSRHAMMQRMYGVG